MWSERKRARDLVGETADPYRKNGSRAQRNEHDLPRAAAAAAAAGARGSRRAAGTRAVGKQDLISVSSTPGRGKRNFFEARKIFFCESRRVGVVCVKKRSTFQKYFLS